MMNRIFEMKDWSPAEEYTDEDAMNPNKMPPDIWAGVAEDHLMYITEAVKEWAIGNTE